MASVNGFVKVEERFAANLIEVLKARYGRVPSAAFVAIQFNRHNESGKGISQESARRWLRGLSMPSYQNLQVLALWLNVEVGVLVDKFAADDGTSFTKKISCCSDETLLMAALFDRLPTHTKAEILTLVRCCSGLTRGTTVSATLRAA